MSDETKIVRSETKKDQSKTGTSKVQIRQVDAAIIEAQKERLRQQAARKVEAMQKKQQGAAKKDAPVSQPAKGTPLPKSAVPAGRPMPKGAVPTGKPMPKGTALGKPMPKSAVPQKKSVVPQPDKNKMAAWEKYHFQKMFVGSDWKGTPQWNKFEEQFAPLGVEIVYLPHTDGISSTGLTEVIKDILDEKPQN